MKTTVYVPDIECDSCVKVIKKVAAARDGVEEVKVNTDSVSVLHDSSKISAKDLVSMIQEKGFRASLTPFGRKTFTERWRDFRKNQKKYEVEYQMLRYALFAFILIVVFQGLAYIGSFRNIPGFVSEYGWWLFYLDLAVISVASATWHFKSYKTQVTSMVGMMVGMTFGMQTGMMLGTIFGATNGLFVGGMVGMLVAVGLGVYNGKCCGIMGVMEGMMAGVMGGVMGSMIGTMFRVDHILWFMPFFMVINLAIMWGLSYMLFEETVEGNPKTAKEPVEFLTFFSYTLIAVALLTIIMLYGPKTGLASVLGGLA